MTRKWYLSFICLALILPAQITLVTVAQSSWYRVTEDEGDFAIEFPGRPTYEEVLLPGTEERLRTYNLAYGNNYLSFSYIDLHPPIATKAPAATRLDEYARHYTKTITGAGGQVLMQTPLPDGGAEFVSKYPAGKSREISYEQSRVYFQSVRRYILSCTSLSASGIDQFIAGRFFSSFRHFGMEKKGGLDKDLRKLNSSSLNGNAADAAWYRFASLDGDFEAEFPNKPDYDTKAHPVTGTQMQVVSFTYGDYDFGVQSSELVPSPTTLAEREQWLASATEKYLRGSESRLIRQTRLSDGALQIESRRQLDGRTTFIRARVYVRGSHGYVVSGSVFGQSLAALDEPLPARFFASFRFK